MSELDRCHGPVLRPNDPGFDIATSGYNTVIATRPAAVVVATGADDVATAVRHAADLGAPLAVRATGHGPSVTPDDTILVATHRMRGVHVDPHRRTAVVEAGTRWIDVLTAADEHGLAPLSGSNPHVGAVGYTTGGGLGLLGRRYGYAADHVRSIDIVTADGVLRRACPDQEPDLFRAVRGGKDNFGIVVRMEIDLMPVSRLLGGGLYFSAERSAPALRAYLEWTEQVPEEMSSSVQMIRYPDLPGVPDELRGRHVTHVRIAWSGATDDGERLLAPLRAVVPDLGDTVGPLRPIESGSVHHEPDGPISVLDRNTALGKGGASLADTLLDTAGADASAPYFVELRHHGGAYARQPATANAVGGRDAAYLLLSTSVVGPEGPLPLRAAHDLLHERLAPWTTGGAWVNFFGIDDGTAARVATAYEPTEWTRMRDTKGAYDPDNMFRANYNVPPG